MVSRALLKLFQEIYYWERLGYEMPHYASEAYTKNDEQRFLRENILLIVRDYNRYQPHHSLDDTQYTRFKVK